MTNHDWLARGVLSGTFGNTFYARPLDQLRRALPAARDVHPEFLAKLALGSRCPGVSPLVGGLLLATLSQRDPDLFATVARRALDGPQMVQGYAWVARSGILGGRINLSASVQRRALQAWFDRTRPETWVKDGSPQFGLLNALRCFHAKGRTPDKQALLSAMHGGHYCWSHLTGQASGLPALADSGTPLPYRSLLASGRIGESWADVPHLGEAPERSLVALDVSFSMHMPIRPHSPRTCLAVGAVLAAALARRSGGTILAYHTEVEPPAVNVRDTVETISAVLVGMSRGGTDPSAPLRWLNQRDREVEAVTVVSDESSGPDRCEAMQDQWHILKRRCPQAKLYCVDLAPPARVRREYSDALQLSGFSDQGFEAIQAFATGVNYGERIDNLDLEE